METFNDWLSNSKPTKKPKTNKTKSQGNITKEEYREKAYKIEWKYKVSFQIARDKMNKKNFKVPNK